jgi:glycosyltransferase involved in cell wall biosynthesis
LGGRGNHRLLKILHIDPEKNWGGGEAQVLGLLKYLAAKGHHTDLLAHPDGLLAARCRGVDITTRPLVMRNHLDVRCVASVRRLIRTTNYDIVHFHTKRAHVLSLWLPRGQDRPKYLVTRRMDYPEPPGWYTNVLYNRRVDGVVAISRAIAEVLVHAGVDEKRIRVICSGIDWRIFARAETPQSDSHGPLVVGCLAGLEERKGHHYLLEAAAMLKPTGLKIQYKIGGHGPLRQTLEAQAKRLNLTDEVHFTGFVADAAQFFASADICVMPSLYEGLGVAALEAMAAGRPVVASRVGGLAESVVDGVSGFLVDAGDPAALAAAIEKFARCPSLAASMGSEGRDRVRRHFSLEGMASANESYYYELLGEDA